MATRIGSKADGPTFCWHCNRQLRRAPGEGLFFYVLVEDQNQVRHRVHGACVQSAVEDGNKEIST